MASWSFLVASVAGAWFTYNAFRPSYWPAPLSVWSFFAGWLTAELAFHQLLFQLVAVAAFVASGALDAWPGWVGLAITGLSWVGMTVLIVRSFGARHAVDSELERALGAAYHEHLPANLKPRSPAIDWRQVLFPFPIRRPDAERVKDVAYHEEPGRKLLLDVYRHPSHPTRCPTLLYVHGGGWVIGHKNHQGLPLMQYLASLGWVCFGINYRLSPRATFPDHIVDVKRAIKFVRENGAKWGADPSFLVLTGGSAGGHLSSLAALTANDPALQPGFEDVDTSVAACVPFYGVYDFVDEGGASPNRGLLGLLEKHVMKRRLAEHRPAYEAASPLYRVHADAPAFLVVHGDKDTLVPVAIARAFAARLRETTRSPVAYTEIPGAQHAFEIFPSIRTWLVLHGVARFGTWLHHRHLSAAREREAATPPAA